MAKKRYCCSCCRRKIYAYKMYRYYYPLLHRYAWHCQKCVLFLASDNPIVKRIPLSAGVDNYEKI